MAKTEEKNGINIINDHIKNGTYANVYLLYGDEKYLLNRYRDKLLSAVSDPEDTMNFTKMVGEKINPVEIIDLAETLPFFADRRVILVEGSGFFKSSQEELAEKIKNILDTTVIIFVEQEIDKRNKLYKVVSELHEALCFKTPTEKELAIWVKSMFKNAGKAVEDAAIFKLIESTGSDMMLITNEIDKLISYVDEGAVVDVAAVNEICVRETEGKVFEMVEAIARKNQSRAMSLYHDLLANKEPAMRILFLICRQFDMLLKTKLALAEGKNDSAIASIIGIPSWSVKKYREQCTTYEIKELKDIVERCQREDYRIKTGQVTDVIATELAIVEFSMRC